MRTLVLVLLLLPVALPTAADAIEIVFDYRFDVGFFDTLERREALERAARHFVARIDGELGALPPEGWIAAFPDPSSGVTVSLDDLDVPADTVRVFVGARPLMEGDRLAMGGPGNLRLPCTRVLGPEVCHQALAEDAPLDVLADWVLRFPFRARHAALRFPAEGFAPWGGSLSFASDAPWYFGAGPDVPEDHFDFLSSAVHELGHVLGIGTAESWGTRTPARIFEGSEVAREHDGAVPLHDDLSHWADGTVGRAEGGSRPAAFTRGLAPGERKLLTELDVAALLDIGWSRRDALSAPPSSLYAGRRIKGDVNGDGLVGQDDLLAVRRLLEGDERFAAADIDAADVAPVGDDGSFGDGTIDGRDRELLSVAARWSADPVEEHVWIPFPCADPLPPFVVRRDDGQCWFALHPIVPEDLDAFALLGWGPPPDDHSLPEVREGPPLKGDVDRDGVLDERDVELIELYLTPLPFDDQLARDAADVAPSIAGNSVGDGQIDERDLALLEAALSEPDVDGDGIDTWVENELNMLWMAIVGRPRHGPLLRWTDDCLEPVGSDGVPAILSLLLFDGELRFDFCSRDGTPWSLSPGISPEAHLQEQDASPTPRPAPVPRSARDRRETPRSASSPSPERISEFRAAPPPRRRWAHGGMGPVASRDRVREGGEMPRPTGGAARRRSFERSMQTGPRGPQPGASGPSAASHGERMARGRSPGVRAIPTEGSREQGLGGKPARATAPRLVDRTPAAAARPRTRAGWLEPAIPCVAGGMLLVGAARLRRSRS